MKTKLIAGVLASAIAGAINGGLITYLGFWEKITSKFEAASESIAFTMHMFFSILTGVLFVIFLSKKLDKITKCIAYGILFSVVIYLLALIPISFRFGTDHINITNTTYILRILIGHASFGMLVGIGYYLILKRLPNKC